MKKYTVVQIGLGPRGIIHLTGFEANSDRFKIAGICDLIPERVKAAADMFSYENDMLFDDAEQMIAKLRPDIVSFATLPHVRSEIVELAVKYKAIGLVFEKPMATSLKEARYITELCEKNNIKAIVCHQHKYLESFQKLNEYIESGELGKIYRIDDVCQAFMAQLGTHYMDYILWANRGVGAESVIGHIHGTFMLTDSHPSPDHFMGEIVMKNGVRSNLQCGYFSKRHSNYQIDYEKKIFPIQYWTDDRLTVYGDTGYAWAECNGRWGAFTSKTEGKIVGGKCTGFLDEQDAMQIMYTKDFTAWLDDDDKIHPCNIKQAYHGHEIIEAICLSALDKTRIDLPLLPPFPENILTRMEKELPPVKYRTFP